MTIQRTSSAPGSFRAPAAALQCHATCGEHTLAQDSPPPVTLTTWNQQLQALAGGLPLSAALTQLHEASMLPA